uniref:Uncharacterized protein n=1 Tax=Caenorhabditis japonica TaxID=281687 RepID=A0A8R1IY61_CAEJA
MIPRNVNPLNFSIPTTADELKVRIEFMYFDADSIVLIDNLHYNGQICEIVLLTESHVHNCKIFRLMTSQSTNLLSPHWNR